MSWLDKIKMATRRFFASRNGLDNLGLASTAAALALNLFASFTGSGLMSMLSTVLYIWVLYRMLSKNLVRRAEENRKFTEWFRRAKRDAQQFIARMKNLRKYKYVKCPKCGTRIRMPRGIGEKTVACPHCGDSFRQKA